MTQQEIKFKIRKFLKVLVYEAQFLAFQKKTINEIRDKDLKTFADTELRKIKDCIKKGEFDAAAYTRRESPELATPFSMPSSNNKIKISGNSQIPQKKKPGFPFKTTTYGQLMSKLDCNISFLERMIKAKGLETSINTCNHIQDQEWEAIKDYVLNKLNLLDAHKKADIEKAKPIVKKTHSSTPLDQYVGGNFGRLIFIGKTR